MLGDEIARTLPVLRAQAESMMLDTITITRPGAVTTDPATGQVVAAGEPVYSGKARWKPATSQATTTDTAGTAVISSTPGEVHVPTSTPYVPQPGDVIVCTASTLNPHLVGARTVVKGRVVGSAVTAYRIPVED
jgi:hypothetical protein